MNAQVSGQCVMNAQVSGQCVMNAQVSGQCVMNAQVSGQCSHAICNRVHLSVSSRLRGLGARAQQDPVVS